MCTSSAANIQTGAMIARTARRFRERVARCAAGYVLPL